MVEQSALLELEAVNQALAATGQPFKLALVPLDQLRLLDKNARYMPHEMFQNLVENIKRDGGLSSVPFCWFDGSVYHVLSGNHRSRPRRPLVVGFTSSSYYRLRGQTRVFQPTFQDVLGFRCFHKGTNL
jgi:hypothetical protein